MIKKKNLEGKFIFIDNYLTWKEEKGKYRRKYV